jgi:hypothetical protein
LTSGLAGGTLLYVTFFEVLEREKLEKVGMTGLLGAFLLIIGFSMMAGLEAVGKLSSLILFMQAFTLCAFFSQKMVLVS